jgi:hypothetical protein
LQIILILDLADADFDTDYVLVKEEHASTARETLEAAGHQLIAG